MPPRWEEVWRIPGAPYRLERFSSNFGVSYRLWDGNMSHRVPAPVAAEILRLAQQEAERASLQEEIPAALARQHRRMEGLERRLDDHDRRPLSLETEARTVEETIRRWEARVGALNSPAKEPEMMDTPDGPVPYPGDAPDPASRSRRRYTWEWSLDQGRLLVQAEMVPGTLSADDVAEIETLMELIAKVLYRLADHEQSEERSMTEEVVHGE